MPAKSVIEIDVNDQSFRQFNALFQRYQQQLKATPQQWRNAATAQQQSVKGTRDLSQAHAMLIGQTDALAAGHKSVLNLLRQEESSWQRIRRQTTGAAANIKDMTGQLLKWGSLTGVISGLVGAGGLFGISRLAGNVASGRQSALGLGATYGGTRAFGTAFGRFGDPGSLLSGVEDARTDITKRSALYGAGLTEKDLTGDTATVGAKVLASIREIAKHTDDALLTNVFDMRKLGNLGITPEMFRTLKRTSDQEFAQQQAQFRKLSGDYVVGSKEQRVYQDFTTALDDASNRIENVFVKGLAPLIPGMEKLSGSIVRTIENLAKAIPPDAMQRIGHGIETFGQYLGSDQFQNDVKGVAALFGYVAGKARDLGLLAAGDTSGNQSIRNAAAGHRAARLSKSSWGDQMQAGAQNMLDIMGGTLGPKGPISRLVGRPGDPDALPMKPGAGELDPGLASLARSIRGKVPGFDQITAGADTYHKGFNSAHNDGRAFDFTIKNPADAAAVAELVRQVMRAEGVKGRVIDEYNYPSKNATGGHIHVQTDVRISNATGNNLVVQTQQAIPSP